MLPGGEPTAGLSVLQEHGAFWIAGDPRLDLAAVNKVEMLPWDVWGAGWEPGEEPTDELLSLFDSVADLTVDPDSRGADLRERYDADPRLRMDGTVFSVARGRVETVSWVSSRRPAPATGPGRRSAACPARLPAWSGACPPRSRRPRACAGGTAGRRRP